jgi:hypothetical protein
VEAVRFAKEQGLQVAVQATGHGVARPANGALLINTARMHGVKVNAESKTAWVEAGAEWGVVLEAAQVVGLAPLLGSSPGVGAVGYTLGGGMGWLARKYGTSADNVIAFDVVTANGELVRASETENDDLFWAMRGGGGSFGVVTGMQIRLVPVTTVYAGNLIYPIEDAKEVYVRYREWINTAPDELTSAVLIMNYPPIPEIPDFLRGQTFVQVRGAYTGDLTQGEALLQYWRDWKTPVADLFGALPFSQAALISNDPIDPLPGVSSSVWVRELDDALIDIIIKYAVAHNGFMVAEIRHAGGAVARVDPRANAYGNRDAKLVLQLIGSTPTLEDLHNMEAYMSEFKQAMQPYLTGGFYINFLEGKEHRERIKDAYTPENFDRLTATKAKYDRDNVFGFSFNIPAAQDALEMSE